MRLTFLAAALLIPTAGFAADPVADTIAARQGFYKLLGANMGTLAAMAKGEVEYDAEGAQTAADNMAVLTSYNLAHLYMPGTSSDDSDASRALPKIWEDFAGVGEKGAALGEAVATMKVAAGQGQAEMGAALGALGGACKGCHDTYRKD